MHRNVFPHVLLFNNLLVQIGRRAPGELVVALFLTTLVGLDEVAQELCGLVLFDHAHVDIATRAQVIENTSLDSLGADIDGPLSVQTMLPR